MITEEKLLKVKKNKIKKICNEGFYYYKYLNDYTQLSSQCFKDMVVADFVNRRENLNYNEIRNIHNKVIFYKKACLN